MHMHTSLSRGRGPATFSRGALFTSAQGVEGTVYLGGFAGGPAGAGRGGGR